jgi:hypothetical protein
MAGSPRPPDRAVASFDWIDVLLVFATLCAAFALAAAFGTADSSKGFQYATAAAIVVVIVVRRAIRPPRVASVGTRRSALGLLGAAAMIVGLAITSLGGVLLLEEWKRPVEGTRIDRDRLEKDLGLPALAPSCVRDGKPVRGRPCLSAEQLAAEAARDAQLYAEEVAALEAQKRRTMGKQARVLGVGVALVLLGIGLDVWRTRRDRAEGPS